jgi:hypothetical protein
VHHDRRASVLVELGQAAYVVDVGVGADDGLHGELVAPEETQDAFHLIARIDDDAFERARIADDGTVALQHADRDFEIDHLRVGRIGHAVRKAYFVHRESISLGFCRIISSRGWPSADWPI